MSRIMRAVCVPVLGVAMVSLVVALASTAAMAGTPVEVDRRV